MTATDRRPLNDTPITARIAQQHNNRIGAVYSSLHAFWQARHAVTNNTTNRRDAYSVILFNHTPQSAVTNDFSNTPDQLLASVLPHRAGGGTNFDSALQLARATMGNNWSTER